MKTALKFLSAFLLASGFVCTNAPAQTGGSATLAVTINDYNGSGAKHYAVAWVTTSTGTFIKSLRKQGPSSWTSSQWGSHCSTWNTARGGSTVLDGYSSATATNYTGTNSPIILTWDGRNTNSVLVADGTYKFWVQYAEDGAQGPHTTNGLLWTKGTTSVTTNYSNLGANFTGMRVTWIATATVAPSITSATPPATGTVGTPYAHTCTAVGTAPIRFTAVNLPPGLVISTNGVISGTPTSAGTYSGTITATNGTVPNASQAFSIGVVNPNIGYVGSATCGNCHPARYAQLQQSIHSKMIRVGANQPGVIHGDLRRPNAPSTNNVHWAMGGWFMGENYIRTNWSGSNWTYTVTAHEWDAIAGTYVNNLPERDWTRQCAGCHTTGFDPATRTWAELNIGCESCHGPGADHVDSEGDPSLIVIDRSAETCGRCHIRADNVAMGSFTNRQFAFPIGYVSGQPNTLQFIAEPLSATNSFFPDGTSKAHRQQYLDMNHPAKTAIKHYQEGVNCTSCHDPHTVGMVSTYASALPANTYGIKIYDNGNQTTSHVAWDGGNLWHPITHVPIGQTNSADLCKACHTVSDHHVHQFNATALAANVNCIDCHMPDVIHVDPATLHGPLRPHSFSAFKPENSMKYGAGNQPNSCTYRCHQDKGAAAVQRAAWADSILTQRLLPPVASGAGVRVSVVGTPEYQYAIQVSSNLTTWMAVTTNTAATLTNAAPRWGFEYSEPAGTATPRFYRSQQVIPAP